MMKLILYFLSFVIGLTVGVTVAFKSPNIIYPHLPEAITGKVKTIEGIVLKKELNGQSLLISIDTERGALVATFTRKVRETDLLIDTGNAVHVVINEYEPFIRNPVITRVEKTMAASQPQTLTPPVQAEEPPAARQEAPQVR